MITFHQNLDVPGRYDVGFMRDPIEGYIVQDGSSWVPMTLTDQIVSPGSISEDMMVAARAVISDYRGRALVQIMSQIEEAERSASEAEDRPALRRVRMRRIDRLRAEYAETVAMPHDPCMDCGGRGGTFISEDDAHVCLTCGGSGVEGVYYPPEYHDFMGYLARGGNPEDHADYGRF